MLIGAYKYENIWETQNYLNVSQENLLSVWFLLNDHGAFHKDLRSSVICKKVFFFSRICGKIILN